MSSDYGSSVSATVRITADSIHLLPQCIYIDCGEGGTRVYFAEIVGMHLERSSTWGMGSECASLRLVAVSNSLERRTFVLRFGQLHGYEENRRAAMPWLLAIRHTIGYKPPPHRASGSSFSLASALPQPMLVLLTKRTESRFHKTFAHILDTVNMDYRIALLENKRHCSMLIKSYDISQFDGIFLLESISMLSEVVSSIIRRPDRLTTGRMPLCWISNEAKEPSAACLTTVRDVLRRRRGHRKHRAANAVCRSLAKRTLSVRCVAHVETGQLHHALVDHLVAGAGGSPLRRYLTNNIDYARAVHKLRGRSSIEVRLSFIEDESATVSSAHRAVPPAFATATSRYRRRNAVSAPPPQLHYAMHNRTPPVYSDSGYGVPADDTLSVCSAASSWHNSTHSMANSAFPYTRPDSSVSAYYPDDQQQYSAPEQAYASSLYNKREPDAFNALIYRASHTGHSLGASVPPLHRSLSSDDRWTHVRAKCIGVAIQVTGMQSMAHNGNDQMKPNSGLRLAWAPLNADNSYYPDRIETALVRAVRLELLEEPLSSGGGKDACLTVDGVKLHQHIVQVTLTSLILTAYVNG